MIMNIVAVVIPSWIMWSPVQCALVPMQVTFTSIKRSLR